MFFDAFHILYKGEPLEVYSTRFACTLANYTVGDLVDTRGPCDGVLVVTEQIACRKDDRVILLLVDGFFLDYLVCEDAAQAEQFSAALVQRWSDRDCQAAAFRLLARKHASAWRASLKRIHEVRLAVREDDRRAQQVASPGKDGGAALRRRLQQILAADSSAWPAWNSSKD